MIQAVLDTNILISATFWNGKSYQISLLAIEENVVPDDPNDNPIIEAAMTAGANYVISQDRHLLRLKKIGPITMIGPKDFLDLIKNENG